jgi:hypothetical protein
LQAQYEEFYGKNLFIGRFKIGTCTSQEICPDEFSNGKILLAGSKPEHAPGSDWICSAAFRVSLWLDRVLRAMIRRAQFFWSSTSEVVQGVHGRYVVPVALGH